MIKRLLYLPALLLLSSPVMEAQQIIKVKRTDNRFLFFQAGVKNDTIIKNKSDLFMVHFPDSAQHRLVIHLRNGQLMKTANDSLFRLAYIPGMKYSLSKPEEEYTPLLEGICDPEKIITIDIKNVSTGNVILHNTFIVK